MRLLARRRFLAILSLGLLLLGLPAWSPAGTPAERSARITLLQLNDLSDITPAAQGKTGGLARVAALRERVARESPHTVLVLAGDFLSPSTMSSAFQGEQMVAALDSAGLDLATFGNHEFDYGQQVTRDRMRESRFTWLSSNVLDPKTGLPFGDAVSFVLRQYGQIRVAFIGLTTPDTAELSKGAQGLRFLDPVKAAREAVTRARRARADVIVALTHLYLAEDRKLAAAVPEIDLILGGHDHDSLHATVGRTLIFKAGSDAVSLGRIDLSVRVGASRQVEATWALLPVTDQLPEEPRTAAVIRQYADGLQARLGVRVGETAAALDTRNEVVRTQESAVGNLVADLIRDATFADVALINGGGLRGNAVTPAGPLTRGDLLKILPFGNKVVKLAVSGAALRAALENGVSQVEKTAGRFPQVAGLRYRFDPARPAGSRLLSVEVGGKPLDPQATYTLATFDFVAGGGDGYTMFKEARLLVPPEVGPMDSDLLLERLKLGSIAPALDGRIQRLP